MAGSPGGTKEAARLSHGGGNPWRRRGAELRQGGRRKKSWEDLVVNFEKFRNLSVN
jgi:hypothetical protein